MLVLLPARTFPGSASLLGTVVVGDHERGYPALLFLHRRSHKRTVQGRAGTRAGVEVGVGGGGDGGGALHDTRGLLQPVVSGEGGAVQDAAGREVPCGGREPRFQRVPFPLLLPLRQLSVAQLVNKPGGQSFGRKLAEARRARARAGCVRACVRPLCKRCHAMLGLGGCLVRGATRHFLPVASAMRNGRMGDKKARGAAAKL